MKGAVRDALQVLFGVVAFIENQGYVTRDRKSTRLNSSHSQISYAVFCLKKKNRRAAPGRTSRRTTRPARRRPRHSRTRASEPSDSESSAQQLPSLSRDLQRARPSCLASD